MKAYDAGYLVKAAIKAHDLLNAVPLHDRRVERIASGEPGRSEQDVTCPLKVQKVDREDLVDNPQKNVESRLDRLAATDRVIPIENFLKYFSVCNQPFPRFDRPFDHLLRPELVRVIGPDEVHRNVGVDEDHAGGSKRYPRSISLRI